MNAGGISDGVIRHDSRSLGAAIGKARLANGFTQQDLCSRADLSYSTLAKIERGAIKSPNIFTVVTIAHTLNMTVEELVGLEAPKPVSTRNLKTAKSGVTFVYFDINGVLVRFFHHAFSQLAQDTGASAAMIENTFWHYNDAVCRGEMTMEEFNQVMSTQIKVPVIDWMNYYLDAIQPIPEVQDALKWAAEHFKIGLLSNIMPGFIPAMIKKNILPDLDYDSIIDSSVVHAIKPEAKIYQTAQEQAKTPADQILLIDDSRTNLMSAERLDWQVMWFDDYRPEESVARIKDILSF